MKHGSPRTLAAVADLIGARLQGEPTCLINGIAPLESATFGDLSFLTHQKYRQYLSTSSASAVIVGLADVPFCQKNILVSDNPRLSLAKAIKLFQNDTGPMQGIHQTAVIGKNCRIPESASVGPYVVIGDNVALGEKVVINAHCVIGNGCVLGDETILKPRVTFYDAVRVGKHCLIHSGAVIGSDGFGFANEKGRWVRMPHLGGVSLGDSVEVGANTTIDRGFLEDTSIGENAVIDNLVQIAHNVSVGAHTAIAACVGIAGSTKIGDKCLIGGASSIAGHLNIADGVQITATSGVNHSLNVPDVYSSGLPAKPARLWRKNAARFQSLDLMAKRLRALESFSVEELAKRLEKLEDIVNSSSHLDGG